MTFHKPRSSRPPHQFEVRAGILRRILFTVHGHRTVRHAALPKPQRSDVGDPMGTASRITRGFGGALCLFRVLDVDARAVHGRQVRSACRLVGAMGAELTKRNTAALVCCGTPCGRLTCVWKAGHDGDADNSPRGQLAVDVSDHLTSRTCGHDAPPGL